MWALITGIAGFVLIPLFLLTSIAAIVLGAIGLKRGGETGTGKGMAAWGIGLGVVQILVGITVVIAAMVFVLVQGLGDLADDRVQATALLEDADADPELELVVYVTVYEDGNTTSCDCRVTIVLEEGAARRELVSEHVSRRDFGVHADAPGDGRAMRYVFDRDLPCDEETRVRVTVEEDTWYRSATVGVC